MALLQFSPQADTNKLQIITCNNTTADTVLTQTKYNTEKFRLLVKLSGFDGLEVACWPFVPKFARFPPGRSRRIFSAKKSSARLPSEGK
jgi:hypothetical protein